MFGGSLLEYIGHVSDLFSPPRSEVFFSFLRTWLALLQLSCLLGCEGKRGFCECTLGHDMCGSADSTCSCAGSCPVLQASVRVRCASCSRQTKRPNRIFHSLKRCFLFTPHNRSLANASLSARLFGPMWQLPWSAAQNIDGMN